MPIFSPRFKNSLDVGGGSQIGFDDADIVNFLKPDSISKDVTIRSMRLSQKFRIIGYREGEYFYIVWFDNKHETC